MDDKILVYSLRVELDSHNYYVLSTPPISDKKFYEKVHQLMFITQCPGMTIISGFFEKNSRDEIIELIESNDGKNAKSINKNTTFVVVGDNMGSTKLEKCAS